MSNYLHNNINSLSSRPEGGRQSPETGALPTSPHAKDESLFDTDLLWKAALVLGGMALGRRLWTRQPVRNFVSRSLQKVARRFVSLGKPLEKIGTEDFLLALRRVPPFRRLALGGLMATAGGMAYQGWKSFTTPEAPFPQPPLLSPSPFFALEPARFEESPEVPHDFWNAPKPIFATPPPSGSSTAEPSLTRAPVDMMRNEMMTEPAPAEPAPTEPAPAVVRTSGEDPEVGKTLATRSDKIFAGEALKETEVPPLTISPPLMPAAVAEETTPATQAPKIFVASASVETNTESPTVTPQTVPMAPPLVAPPQGKKAEATLLPGETELLQSVSPPQTPFVRAAAVEEETGTLRIADDVETAPQQKAPRQKKIPTSRPPQPKKEQPPTDEKKNQPAIERSPTRSRYYFRKMMADGIKAEGAEESRFPITAPVASPYALAAVMAMRPDTRTNIPAEHRVEIWRWLAGMTARRLERDPWLVAESDWDWGEESEGSPGQDDASEQQQDSSQQQDDDDASART